MSRPYIGPSESQGNAEILANRNRTYSGDHDRSITLQWQVHKRQPKDLREAERAVRKAYSDEVPTKVHESRNAGTFVLAEDGSPRMTARAEAYIFGNPLADDAGRDPETGARDLVGWYYAPFRALVATFRGEGKHKQAAIVEHVTIGSMTGVQAAIREEVPAWCSYVVAESVLRDFLRRLTDLRIHAPQKEDAA